MDQSTHVRWDVENGIFTYKADSLMDLVEKTEPFTLEGVADKIKCSTLVCGAEDDHFFAGQPQQLYDALTCPKSYKKFTAYEGAGEHCHYGALLLFNHHLFNCLDQTLNLKEVNPLIRSREEGYQILYLESDKLIKIKIKIPLLILQPSLIQNNRDNR